MEEQLTFEFSQRPTIKGFPELRWTGKRPYRSTQYYPAQLRETYGEEKDGWIAVAVSNAVAQRVAGTESTKIGLRTCSKILEGLGGSFSTERKGSRFSAGFLLPI